MNVFVERIRSTDLLSSANYDEDSDSGVSVASQFEFKNPVYKYTIHCETELNGRFTSGPLHARPSDNLLVYYRIVREDLSLSSVLGEYKKILRDSALHEFSGEDAAVMYRRGGMGRDSSSVENAK